jgi:hypothetical protein
MIFCERTFFVLTDGRDALSRSEVDLEESPIVYSLSVAQAVDTYEHCIWMIRDDRRGGMEAELWVRSEA